MKLRTKITLLFICMTTFCLSGCAKESCTLEVMVAYCGWGIDGQDLGSGKFTDSFTVFEGDEFYEGNGGNWLKKKEKNEGEALLISVEKIEEDGVTIKVDHYETKLEFDKVKEIDSRYDVADGINYYYDFYFTKEEEQGTEK